MSLLKPAQVVLAIVIAGAIYAAGAVAVTAGDTDPAPVGKPVASITPWGIDWGIGAACYKGSDAASATVSCIKVSPEELELFKKLLEAQRPS